MPKLETLSKEARSAGWIEPASSIDQLTGYNLKRVYMLFRDNFPEAMGEEPMTGRAFAALSVVIDSPGITQSAVARQLGVERSGMVAIVDELEDLGYLRRVAVPGDRRTQALQPTEDGRRAMKTALDRVAKSESDLLSPLDGEEQRLFLEMLQRIRAIKKEE